MKVGYGAIFCMVSLKKQHIGGGGGGEVINCAPFSETSLTDIYMHATFTKTTHNFLVGQVVSKVNVRS